jgi:pyruvate dehydrogenase E1 component alpha subunit
MTPTATHLSSVPAKRIAGFGIASQKLDGVDAEAMMNGIAAAIATAREGKPVFIEAECFRFGGHYAADPARYRPVGEDETWRASHCPVKRLGHRLGLSDDDLGERIDAVRAEASEMIRRYAG